VYGLGEAGGGYGAADAADQLNAAILTMTEVDAIKAVIGPISDLASPSKGISAAVYSKQKLEPLLKALKGHVTAYAISGVASLDDYIVYLNTAGGTKWQALQHPDWRAIYLNSTGSVPASAAACYFEVLQGATYANALGKLIVGTGFTDGVAIDGTHFAGGFGYLNVSGLTGTGVVTVTGTAFDPADKTLKTAKTFTATVVANGLIALAPGGGSAAPANSLLVDVTGIAAAGGISAGTIYAEAHRPAGRPLLP
jgi:hypothetical protein